MACFRTWNSCCGYYTNPYWCMGQTGPTGPQGPIGPPGPTGPTGPTGETAIANFTNAAATPIATGGTVPLADGVNLATGFVAHTTGSADVSLQPGYYLVSYATSATSATLGDISLVANLGGTPIASSTSIATLAAANDIGTLASEFIVNVTTAGTILNLINSGANSTSYDNLNLVIRYLGTTV